MLSAHNHGKCELCDEIEKRTEMLTTWQAKAAELLEQALARTFIKNSYYADHIRELLSIEYGIEKCCCVPHHRNVGRCLQCPIHGQQPLLSREAQERLDHVLKDARDTLAKGKP